MDCLLLQNGDRILLQTGDRLLLQRSCVSSETCQHSRCCAVLSTSDRLCVRAGNRSRGAAILTALANASTSGASRDHSSTNPLMAATGTAAALAASRCSTIVSATGAARSSALATAQSQAAIAGDGWMAVAGEDRSQALAHVLGTSAAGASEVSRCSVAAGIAAAAGVTGKVSAHAIASAVGHGGGKVIGIAEGRCASDGVLSGTGVASGTKRARSRVAAIPAGSGAVASSETAGSATTAAISAAGLLGGAVRSSVRGSALLLGTGSLRASQAEVHGLEAEACGWGAMAGTIHAGVAVQAAANAAGRLVAFGRQVAISAAIIGGPGLVTTSPRARSTREADLIGEGLATGQAGSNCRAEVVIGAPGRLQADVAQTGGDAAKAVQSPRVFSAMRSRSTVEARLAGIGRLVGKAIDASKAPTRLMGLRPIAGSEISRPYALAVCVDGSHCVYGAYRIAAGRVFLPGAETGAIFVPGVAAGRAVMPGPDAGAVFIPGVAAGRASVAGPVTGNVRA